SRSTSPCGARAEAGEAGAASAAAPPAAGGAATPAAVTAAAVTPAAAEEEAAAAEAAAAPDRPARAPGACREPSRPGGRQGMAQARGETVRAARERTSAQACSEGRTPRVA